MVPLPLLLLEDVENFFFYVRQDSDRPKPLGDIFALAVAALPAKRSGIIPR